MCSSRTIRAAATGTASDKYQLLCMRCHRGMHPVLLEWQACTCWLPAGTLAGSQQQVATLVACLVHNLNSCPPCELYQRVLIYCIYSTRHVYICVRDTWVCAAGGVLFLLCVQRPITVNFGMRMPGWYDIASLEDIDQREDKEGLHESKRCARLNDICSSCISISVGSNSNSRCIWLSMRACRAGMHGCVWQRRFSQQLQARVLEQQHIISSSSSSRHSLPRLGN